MLREDNKGIMFVRQRKSILKDANCTKDVNIEEENYKNTTGC